MEKAVQPSAEVIKDHRTTGGFQPTFQPHSNNSAFVRRSFNRQIPTALPWSELGERIELAHVERSKTGTEISFWKHTEVGRAN